MIVVVFVCLFVCLFGCLFILFLTLLPIAVAQSILKVKNLKEYKFDEIINFGGMKTVISMK